MGGGSGIMSKSKQVSEKPNAYEQRVAEIADQLYTQTQPLRDEWMGMQTEVAKGNYDPRSLPTYKPLYDLQRTGIEDQYGVAKENLMGAVPRGGGLTDALAQLEMGRASDVAGASWQTSAQILQDLLNKSYGTAWGAPGEALGAFGNVSGTMAQKTAAQMGAQANRFGSEMGIVQKMTPSAPQCCFIFLAANDGVLIDVARRYRDEYMTERNRRGYYKLADVLVPRMKRSGTWKRLVQTMMVNPMIAYGRHVYRGSRCGALFAPITAAWLLLFDCLGIRKNYTRRGSGEVV